MDMTAAREIKSLFYDDIKMKKAAGHSARRKRNGSRTSYVSLPSDYKTKKELREMNGEVKSYNLSEPMTFQEFREMPADLRRQYLTVLVHTYGATMHAIADVFGVSAHTFRCAVEDCGVSGMFSRGARMTHEQELALTKFFHPGEEPKSPPQEDPRPTDAAAPLSMEEFSIRFHGAFDADHVANTLRRMVPAGQQVKISVSCAWEEEPV